MRKNSKSGDCERVRAGAAQADITPDFGTHLAGEAFGVHRPAQSVLDRLYVRAVVFECGGQMLAFVTFDCLMITKEWTDRIRKTSAKRFGFNPDAIMVHATQTHSSPPVGHFMVDKDFLPDMPAELEYLRGGENAYAEFAVEKAIETIGLAVERIGAVKIGTCSAIKEGIGFNRRAVTRTGKVIMPSAYSSQKQPLGPTEIQYIEGPIDPEVGIFCVQDDSTKVIAMLMHYTCHPSSARNISANAVSSDWPGVWAGVMRDHYGEECVPLVLNGCCGDINMTPPFKPDYVVDYKKAGRELGELGRAVVERTQFSEARKLDWRIRHVELPLKDADPERLADAERILGAHPEPLWMKDNPERIDPNWLRAASIMSVELMRKRSPNLLYEIQAFRVGDTAFVGLPGEPFVKGQLSIKIGSPAHYTFVAHLTTQFVGYIPTKDACLRGGHEVDFSYWAKLAPESLDIIVENAIDLLKDMF